MIRFLSSLVLVLALTASALAQAGSDPKPLIDALGTANFKQAETLLGQIAATGDASVAPALEAFAAGDLYARKSDGAVFITRGSGKTLSLIDPITGEAAGEAPKTGMTKIKVNNNLRRAIHSTLGGLTLQSPDRAVRLRAADSVLRSPSAENLELLEMALATETDAAVKARMEAARAVSVLASDRPADQKREAIATIKSHGGRDAIGI